MRFSDYMKRVLQYKENTGQRLGQAMFNILDDNDRMLADMIRATNADPFYRNDLIPKFLSVLYDNGFITFDD